MRLSNSFKLEEFERSNTAGQLGIDNTAPRKEPSTTYRLVPSLSPCETTTRRKYIYQFQLPSPDLTPESVGFNNTAGVSRGHPFTSWTPTGHVKIRGLV